MGLEWSGPFHPEDSIMAEKQKPAPAALVTVPAAVNGSDKPVEVRFGKADKIIKLAFPFGSDKPTGVLFVGKSGNTFLADFSRYPDETKGILLFHGSKQKLGDEYADLDSEDDCMEAAREMDGRLADGKWTSDRQGFTGISTLMRAIMKVYSITEEAAREFLKPLTTKEKMALRATDELKSAIAEIEAEKGKGTDVSKLIEKLKTPAAQPQA
jgi:hypothetical protein